MLAGCVPQHSTAVQLHVQVLATLPHDTTMYTEGLEIHDGVLYESSGLVGQSRVRATALSSAATLREVTLPAPLFGEGLTIAGDRLWQLTWTSGMAIERDPVTLARRRAVTYRGEGWGLCHDGHRLVMSDGSDRLTFRDPATFAPSGRLEVRLDGGPVSALNELDCADGVIWANVFQTDRILRINPGTGVVTGVVDASGLLSTRPRSPGDVLNGIAAIPGTDEFLVTGKHWPSLFRVRFVPSTPAG
ncbi:MAG: glutaminyl-peptide cyclotransferase [Pseudonocardiales bacterium]|nr:glutaminyl-peptide cyclotransferase [Pseudonocardiales bacterium]MBV9029561.1 glutaminyl-peptide cyclotransferase [Pseudonocardiales bacterium]MBW0008521.1 glutaminyl-peptide cyclotransferase [Pseudonocardiales bacterium]